MSTQSTSTSASAFVGGVDHWWSQDNHLKLLRDINQLRSDLFYAQLCMHQLLDPSLKSKGANILDVGCGGGIFTENFADYLLQQGYSNISLSGIDPEQSAIEAATLHLAENQTLVASTLSPQYQCSDLTTFAQATEQQAKYSAIACLEMIEHVEDKQQVLFDLYRLLKPGGVLLLSTINRGLLASFCMVSLLENVLEVIPHGTHDPKLFVSSSELSRMCAQVGLKVEKCLGMNYDFFGKRWKLSDTFTPINYFLQVIKPKKTTNLST